MGFSTTAVPNPISKPMATETTNTETTTTEATTGPFTPEQCAWLRETFGQGPPSNSSQQVTDEAPGTSGTQHQPAEGGTSSSASNSRSQDADRNTGESTSYTVLEYSRIETSGRADAASLSVLAGPDLPLVHTVPYGRLLLWPAASSYGRPLVWPAARTYGKII